MSDPYGFGISNPTDQPINFTGEVPPPSSISDNDPGVAVLKANADHSHALDLGGIDTPWTGLILGPSVAIYAGGFNFPEYTSVGNLCFLRGLVSIFTASPFPFQIGVLPSTMAPKYRQLGLGYGGGAGGGDVIYRIDIATDGQVILQSGVGNPGSNASTSYLSLGSPYYVYSLD